MRAILKFDLSDPDDLEEFALVNKARKMQVALYEIAEEVFRPARKHGYPNAKPFMHIDDWSEETQKVVSELSDMFYAVLEQNNITLE